LSFPPVRALKDGSCLALLYAPGLTPAARRRLLEAARTGHPVDEERAQLVRVVEYTVSDRNPDGEFIPLATDLLHPAHVTPAELAWAYHQRWEDETALAEMKSQLLGPAAVLRSKSPELVEQEIYGLLLTHYAVCSFMTRAADQTELDPDRLSFLRAVRITRCQITDQATCPPDRHNTARQVATTELLHHPNPQRRHRSYPRAVKRARHNSYRVQTAPRHRNPTPAASHGQTHPSA
jgi:hypothetical protein